MRQLFLTGLVLVFFWVGLRAQYDEKIKIRKDVVDYYWEMSSVDSHLIHYPLEMKNNKWITVSSIENELEADVNYRKGYIFIQDSAGKDPAYASTFRFVLFKRKKNKPLIGISKKRYINDKWVTDIAFWEERGGKWFDVAKEILPNLNYCDYLEGGCAEHQKEKILTELLPLHYDFPKKGKTVKVFLLGEGLSAYCMNIDPDNPLCEVRQYIKYQVVDLKWNRSKHQFSIGNFKK